VSFKLKDPDDLIRILKSVDFAEIRLDLTDFDAAAVGRVFASHPRLIATCRAGRMAENLRTQLLAAAVNAGAAYLDLDLGGDVELRRTLGPRARRKGCRIILSHHDFERTPERRSLVRIIGRGFRAGADIVKIACRSGGPADNARLLGLLDHPGPLLVIGMGEKGRITRLLGPLLGSLFTYAAWTRGQETAPGQWTVEELRRRLEVLSNG
jgi:3-dehydroquinate dehydratase type I